MGDNQNAATLFKTAYELAQKDDKDNLQSISFDYAQSLYDLEDLAAADAIYRKMLSLDEAGQAAMIGLARNMVKREQYKEAIELLDKCQSFDADYAEIYRFKMQAYDKMGEVKEISNASDVTPKWFNKGVEAAILAPTAVNQQKFYLEYLGFRDFSKLPKVAAKPLFSMVGYSKIDLGIVKYHFEVGAVKENFEWN